MENILSHYIKLSILTTSEKQNLNAFIKLEENRLLILRIIKSSLNKENLRYNLDGSVFMFIFKSHLDFKNKLDLDHQLIKIKMSIILLCKMIIDDLVAN
jgi:hypothetical protein